jgi:hypothetical protein
MAAGENLNSVLDLTAKIKHIFQASHMKFGTNRGPQIFPKCSNRTLDSFQAPED